MVYDSNYKGCETMNTNEIGKLSGVSLHTLHHYDKITILSPRRNPENGYREYTNANIDKLQQIMFFKSCGF